mgnify:CR=1 FL=1
MKQLRKIFRTMLLFSALSIFTVQGQETSSGSMLSGWWAPSVPYDISSPGEEQVVRWGVDTAWLWSWWPLRATNHMQECVGLGRVTITPRTSGSYTSLEDGQTTILNDQLSWLAKSKVKDLYLLAGNGSGSAWNTSYRTPFIEDIALAVLYLQNKGYNVTAISPFNEPDYSANNAPGPEEQATVARMMHQHAVLRGIDIAGPSCLNPDYANSWWNTMKNDIDIGNTHQLAGTFDNFANFYAAVRASGKASAGDEMHNINDALIGMHYGMRDGIWWSDYGGYTRAELGRASLDGACIGYRENRRAWTSAAVFKRYSEPLAEAFLGTSERQAGESAYTFVSQDRLAYYDGYGPYYDYTKDTKGGNGYQNGQTNSEYVIEISYGEDVPVGPIYGTFKIVNKATGKLLTTSALSDGGVVRQAAESSSSSMNQTWLITAVDKTMAGDFSYVTIQSSKNLSYYVEGPKYAGDNGAKVQMYSGGGNECERWHFHYKGNGYYVITNHDSGLSLEGSANNSAGNTSNVVQWARTGTDRQLWRLVPADAKVDDEAPSAPTGLSGESLSGSVRLSWSANTESDILGYMIYRYNGTAGIWETIGRQVKETAFIDNTCAKGKSLQYRIRAVDKSWNVGEPSETIECSTSIEPSRIAQWSLIDNLTDQSENHFNAVSNGVTFASNDSHNGAVFDGSDDYIKLAYRLGDMDEMTFSAWVKPGKTDAWQRVFDFGRNESNYLFFTPNNGSYARFEICKDGVKQGLNATRKLLSGSWVHVTVTIGKDKTCIYFDGKLNASTTDITFKPSDVVPNLSYLGRSMFDSDPLFKGTIGDVCIFNYAIDGDAVQQLYYHDQVGSAEEMLKKAMNKDVKSSLQEALSAVESAISSGDASIISSSLRALSSAMTKAKTSITAYNPLGETLAWSADVSTTYRQTDMEAQGVYDEAYSTIYNNYINGEYANGEISDEVIAVKSFTNRYLMSDAVKSVTADKPVDVSHLLSNSDFSDNNTKGWTLTTSQASYVGETQFQCFEIWNHTFNLSQTLYGMPNGTYRLDAQAFYRNGGKDNSGSTDVYSMLYINESSVAIAPISAGANSASSTGDWYTYATSKKVPNDMEAASAAFNRLRRYRPSDSQNSVTAEYDSSENQALVIGLKKSRAVSDDWTIVNYFKLYYLGDPNATGISSVSADRVDTSTGVYDLSGRRIGNDANSIDHLHNGIYIINGKKVVINR